MRLAIELDGVRHEVETSQYAETATLADLVEAVCGTTVPGDDTLWVDDSEHTANARLSDLLLLEGTRVARSRLDDPAAGPRLGRARCRVASTPVAPSPSRPSGRC